MNHQRSLITDICPKCGGPVIDTWIVVGWYAGSKKTEHECSA